MRPSGSANSRHSYRNLSEDRAGVPKDQNSVACHEKKMGLRSRYTVRNLQTENFLNIYNVESITFAPGSDPGASRDVSPVNAL